MNSEEELKAQAAFRKQLLTMQEQQPHLFSSVVLEGSNRATPVLNFYIEKIGGSRVIRTLPS